MQINEILPNEYATLFPASHVYNSVEFAELNSCKAERVVYLSVGDSKPRFGIILGRRAEKLMSPFSAPFGSFTMKGKQRLEYMEEAVDLLLDYSRRRGKKLSVTLPSMVYGETELSQWINIFSRKMQTASVELNYQFPLERFDNYTTLIERNARKNLNHALKENFVFQQLDISRLEDVERMYAVINRNRAERGFPLRMTLDQVWATVSRVVTADIFVLSHEGADVAAALVYHVASDIAQVIYWGDIRRYSQLRPMNRLTYSVFKHYREVGLRVLDIGISTEDGVPNFGLCDFKESIGCTVSLKYSFEDK